MTSPAELKPCSLCGFANLPNAKFCSGCATPVRDTAESAIKERRWLTVMFCDIAGWSRLSRQLGLEDASDVLDTYYRACTEVVVQNGGHVAQLLGDGVLAYFGYPTAHEDGAVRALRASVELVKRLGDKPIARRTDGARLNIRVGVLTGWVVVGVRGAQGEFLARGDTTNVAARLQSVAAPNTVVTSELTYQMTRGLFAVEDLGPRALDGVPDPVRLYRVERYLGGEGRPELPGSAMLTPFIGRSHEADSLLASWGEAEKGRSRTVFLVGEPGIGKSRQVRVLREQLEQKGHIVLEGGGSAYHQDTAYHPLVEPLERSFGFTREQTPEQRLAQMEERLARRGLEASAPALASLLSLPATGKRYEQVDLTPKKRREATFRALAGWLQALATEAPVLFVMEDLHWLDASTLDFLSDLIREGVPGVLALLTARPAPHFVKPWQDPPRFLELNLDRLDKPQAREMIQTLAGGKPLPPEAVDHILLRSEGVPLFLEEITRALLESKDMREGPDRWELAGPIAGLGVPDSLNDWLMTRLNRIGGQAITHVAAVLGRTFRYDIVRELAPDDLPALDRLVDAGLLFRENTSDPPVYRFKHALIQEAAYQSLLPKARQQYHQKIAELLARRFPDLANAQPELMARHCTGAGMTDQAVHHWRLAGQSAFVRSAFLEAINAFNAALEQLDKLSPGAERDRSEIDLQAALGLALIQVKGWSVKEVETSFGRALELCRRQGDVPLRVTFGTWAAFVVRGDREVTAELAPIFERVIRESQDPATRFIAQGLLGAHAFWRGDYRTADDHLRAGKAYCDPQRTREQCQRLFQEYGYDGFLYPHVFMCWSDLYQGRRSEAVTGIEEALGLARATGNPYVMAMAMGWGAALAHDLGDVDVAAQRAEELMSLAADTGLYFWMAIAMSVSGWAAARRGDVDKGLATMRAAVAAHASMGSRVVMPYYLSYIAETCLAAGQIDAGLEAADQGLDIARTNLATHFVPELERLKGELLARRDPEAAELLLRRALEASKAQGAGLFAGRATAALQALRRAPGPISTAL